MWISTEDAMALVRAAAADVEAARVVLRRYEERRNSLLVQLHGQPDVPPRDLAAAAGLTTGRLLQLKLIEPPDLADLERLPPLSHQLRAELATLEAGRRISESKRVRVA